MGHTASKPEPGCKLQVIACGLPRTGTSSFAEALEILLGPPVYHGGSWLAQSNEEHMLKYMDPYRHTPIKCPEDKEAVLAALKALFDGYQGVTDGLVSDFAGEIAELYPDAIVICTTRDPAKWWTSMEPVVEATDRTPYWQRKFVDFALALLPGHRRWSEMSDLALNGRFGEKFTHPRNKAYHPGAYQEHLTYLERVIPKERINYYSVKDGWEPLCKILNRPVPDRPFPWNNDAKAADAAIQHVIQRGLQRWAFVIASVSVATVAGSIYDLW